MDGFPVISSYVSLSLHIQMPLISHCIRPLLTMIMPHVMAACHHVPAELGVVSSEEEVMRTLVTRVTGSHWSQPGLVCLVMTASRASRGRHEDRGGWADQSEAIEQVTWPGWTNHSPPWTLEAAFPRPRPSLPSLAAALIICNAHASRSSRDFWTI